MTGTKTEPGSAVKHNFNLTQVNVNINYNYARAKRKVIKINLHDNLNNIIFFLRDTKF